MKVLLDTCIGLSCLHALREAGMDAGRIGAEEPDPGDEAVLARAASEGRILVTADKDLGEPVFHRGARHAGIIRLTAMPVAKQVSTLLPVLRHYERDLCRGTLLVVSADRVRVRRSPRRPQGQRGER